jgi:hypothetical protein
MKKNWFFRLGTAVLVLSIITLSLVSGTFAKYTLGATDNEVVRAAKFEFDLKNDGNTYDETQTATAVFNIFDYLDAGVYNNGYNDATLDEFIAPGTTGTFALAVDNLSEVDVSATFALVETNADSIPIYYTLGADPQRYSAVLNDDTYNGGADTYQSLAELGTAIAAISLDATDSTTPTTGTFTLNWAWAFNTAGTHQTDAGDTALGVAGTAVVDLSVTATVTQVD